MSEGSHTAEYTRFMGSIAGGDPDAREGLDTEALLALQGDEKKRAESVLLDRLKEEDDWRVPPAISAIRLKRAVRPLKARLADAKGRMRIAVAQALVDLGAMERLDETVIQMLEDGDPDEGITALAAADDLDSKELVTALARASVHHPGPAVRINAGAALLYLSKLSDDPLVWKFRPLYLQLGDEDEKVRREAFEGICELAKLPPAIAD